MSSRVVRSGCFEPGVAPIVELNEDASDLSTVRAGRQGSLCRGIGPVHRGRWFDGVTRGIWPSLTRVSAPSVPIQETLTEIAVFRALVGSAVIQHIISALLVQSSCEIAQ